MNNPFNPKQYLQLIILTSLTLIPFLTKAAPVPVLIIENSDRTAVSLEKELSAFKINNEVAACVSPKELERYYGGSKEKYASTQAKVARCDTKLTKSTTLQSEMSDLENSISEIKQRITSLEMTGKYLDSLRSLDGITLLGIPAGLMENKSFETATDISMKCLQKSGAVNIPITLKDWTGRMGANGAVGAIGSLSLDNISWFNTMPKSQLAILKESADNNKVFSNDIQKKLAANGSKMNDSIALEFSRRMSAMRDIMSQNTIMVTLEDKKQYESILKSMGVNTSFTIEYNFDKDGQKIKHDPSGILAAAAFMAGIKEPFIEVTISIGGISYSGAWLPETTMLNGLKTDNSKSLENLTKLKIKLGKMLEQFKTKLVALNKDTSCN